MARIIFGYGKPVKIRMEKFLMKIKKEMCDLKL